MDADVTYWPSLLSLLAVDLLAAMSPGPNFVLVTQSAVQRTRRYAMAVVLGFVIANLLWCLAVVLGLAVLFEVQPWLYETTRILGGAYLIYLGIQIWIGGGDIDPEQRSGADSTQRAGIVRGLLTNLGNPKSAVYFGSVFAVFLKPGTPMWVQICAVAIVLLDTVLWYGSVVVALSAQSTQRLFLRFKRTIDRAAGALIVIFGIRLLATRAAK